MTHTGHYPRWGGGGQAWCSPTSTSMVLAYYDALPGPKPYAWVGRRHPAPWVDHAARMTYDYDYDGAGNWPFNTAYAARLAGKAFVTRLRSLREAERFIVAGIPVVASISFGRGELDGAPISATNGHLLVIVGFTRTATSSSTTPPPRPPPACAGSTTAASSSGPGSGTARDRGTDPLPVIHDAKRATRLLGSGRAFHSQPVTRLRRRSRRPRPASAR